VAGVIAATVALVMTAAVSMVLRAATTVRTTSVTTAWTIASTVFSILGPKILGKATTKLFEGIVGQISGTGPGIDFMLRLAIS